MELMKIGVLIAAVALQISAFEIVEERRNNARHCSCSTLKVALLGQPMATASAANGIYYKKWDRSTHEYLWRQTSLDGNNWLGNAISKGESYWYIGPIENKFKKGVSCFMTLQSYIYLAHSH